MRFGLFCITVANALPWLAPLTGHAATAAPEAPPTQTSQQATIYQSTGSSVPKGYVVSRDLEAYTSALHPEFGRSLALLGEKDRWLDIGAGEGNAILDYYRNKADAVSAPGTNKAQAVAISIEDRRTFAWHKTAASLNINQIRYYYNKPLRQYTLAELGKFQIISDFLGGFSYTSNLSEFMAKALGFLQVNGSFYSILQDVQSEAGTNAPHYADSPFLTEIVDGHGTKTKVCTWLKSISCVQVSCTFKPDWTPPVEVYRLQKVCDNINVPALKAVHFAAGTPPERRFLLVAPAVPPLEPRVDATK